MTHYVIAVDVGGTFTKGAAVDEHGALLAHRTHATPREPQVALALFEQLCRELRQPGAPPVAVGLGVPGLFAASTGVVVNFPNLPGWEGLDLRGALARAVGLPVALQNDGNCAALGEGWMGAARGAATYLAITLGTGVGCGLVLGGALWPEGGELGHMSVYPGGERCGCGRRGCVEAYASGTAIKRMAREAIEGGRAPLLAELCGGDAGLATPRHVAQAAEQGEAAARAIYDTVGRALGYAISDVVNLLGVRRHVCGGGVSESLPLFEPALREVLEERCFALPASAVEVRRAECGGDAGVLGAARCALLLEIDHSP